MPRWIYQGDKPKLVSKRVPLKGTPSEANMGFHETVLNAYRQVEANGQWRGPYPKGFVKRVHEMARDRQAAAGIG